jgi:hypothetical protein
MMHEKEVSFRKIQILRAERGNSECKMRALVYHEMTHCVFNGGHIKSHLSIMSPKLIGTLACDTYWDRMETDLFKYIDDLVNKRIVPDHSDDM